MDGINEWVNKYKPKNISELIGNETEIDMIKNWLNNYEKNKKILMEKYDESKNSSEDKQKKKKKNDKEVIIEKDDPVDNDKDDIIFDNEHNEDDEYNSADVIIDDYISKPSIKKKNESSILILGNHGIGKTTFATTILIEMGYDIEYLNIYSLSSHKNVNEKINKLMMGTNIFDSLNRVINKKKIIVIDEIEKITSQTEKKFIENFLKANDKFMYYPVVYISSSKHSRTITLIKNYSLTIYMKQPSLEYINILLRKILIGEKLKFDDKLAIDKIREHAQFDYSRLLHIIYDIQKYSKSQLFTLKMLEEYFESSAIKNADIEIYKSSAELILRYKNIDECLRIYNGEKVIIPLMIQQNYPKCITELQNNNKDNLALLCKISECISFGDIVENYIYSEQDWDIKNAHCFYTCVIPSFELNNISISSNVEKIKYSLDFPNDLNRTSIKKINKRNVVNANAYLKNMSIGDFMYANTLTKKLIDDKNITECSNIYKSYGAKADTIISVLKIDKINADKNQYPTNIKKIFNKYL
ncbi:replication factor C large subunit [Bodo saltans virus]|uniref:Replication factor C large subunit n=1 Tax=Bodo saltans virus TaxID=2024608 RepID=A0A2H4UUP1_9VIRU|nr:replication factor C large subunit [Bodo saltans virus]ATZ80577.1 replication factor C large subunit [Bodo saltans virus]